MVSCSEVFYLGQTRYKRYPAHGCILAYFSVIHRFHDQLKKERHRAIYKETTDNTGRIECYKIARYNF